MIPLKPFGRTGHNSTRTIFGAFALGTLTQKQADETLDVLLEYGINHIDTAPSYDNSELRIGPWMKNYRPKFFLATKTDKRTYKEAREELLQSLDRLQTDAVDLWQMHYLVNPADWETAMNVGGALEAFIEAKEQGLVKNLGVTAHGLAAPRMILKSLDKYPFDSVLFPYNFSLMHNTAYAAEANKLLEKCAKDNIAVQTIKSLAKGKLGAKKARHNVWYEPVTDEESIRLAVNWVLGNGQVFLNTAGDVQLMKKILKVASELDFPPTDDIMFENQKHQGIKVLFDGDEM
ncbi:MAG: aldo/keto reductase [Bacteroidales bacterium]|nr:aldo/keto reductase [Bacteroidales bacterium]MBN2820977.1 aldo/keto reductase [Bacteroidales bacterium]